MDENEKFLVDFGETTVVGGGGGTTDFNELTNRPKYNNNTMTGSTNIPKVPTKTSELTNDSDFVESTELATVATSGNYNDLSNKPTIPAAQIQSDWSQTNTDAKDYIKNKPTIPTVNDATLTITQNGTSKGTFTANDADDTTIEVSDTTYSDFTGTDGTSAGAAGLVPAPATTDAGKFLKADGTWDAAGGGSGPTVVQNTGTSTTDVMSQNAVTSMVFADPSTKIKVNIGGSGSSNNSVAIGKNAYSGEDFSGSGSVAIGSQANTYSGSNSVAVGTFARARAENAISIGYNAGHPTADTQYKGAISLGAYSEAHAIGEMNIGSTDTTFGYNNSNYRLISGVYDPQSAHDAATKGYVDGLVGNVASALNVINNGTGA